MRLSPFCPFIPKEDFKDLIEKANEKGLLPAHHLLLEGKVINPRILV